MGEIKVQITPSKPKTLQVSSKNIKNSVQIEENPTHYYSTLAKQWAVKTDGLVQDEDYSSKYWAVDAKKNADIAENSVKTNQNLTEILNQNYLSYDERLNDTYNNAVSELDNFKTDIIKEVENSTSGIIENIDEETEKSINNIQTEGETQVENIKSTGFYMQDGKLYYFDENGEATEFNSGTGGLEVGDIGLALYIDETKGLRRYLNGSILSINANTQAFLNYLKAVQLTNPEYFTTETNWQAEALLNVDGCVFKYVIDETAGTIRLPKYPEYVQIFENSAPVNIAPDGNAIKFSNSEADEVMMLGRSMTVSGVANPSMVTYPATAGSGIRWSALHFGNQTGLTGTANLSGSTTKLKLRYFIQIATGVSESVDITNEYQLNNPFSLLDVKWSHKKLNNSSWLLSEGQPNSQAIYGPVYNLLLSEYNSAEDETETVGEIEITYRYSVNEDIKITTDKEAYDSILSATGTAWYFVLDIENAEFYLPQSDGFMQFGGNGEYVPAGLPNIEGSCTRLQLRERNVETSGALYVKSQKESSFGYSGSIYNIELGFDASRSNPTYGNNDTVQPNAIKGYLYFYVGETVQNANLINAGAITETLATKTDKAQAAHASMPSNRYIDLTLGATNSTYTVPADGFVFLEKWAPNANTYINLVSNNLVTEMMSIFANQHLKVWIPVKKGSNFEVNYNATGVTQFFRFIYAEGAKND